MRPRLSILPGVILSVAIALPVAADEDANGAAVDIRPAWKVGETHRYEQVKSRRSVPPGKPAAMSTGRVMVDIEVVEAIPEGYLVSWTAGEARLDDPAQAADPLVKRMAGLFAGYRNLFEVDGKDASINGVRNWEEIQKKLKATTEVLVAELRKSGEIPPDAIAAMEEQVAAMSSTREQVEKAAAAQAGSFLAATGRTYRIGKPYEYDVELPGPIGGASIPSRGRFTLRSHDVKTGRAVIDWSQTMDPERARAAIDRMIRDLAAKVGRPIDDFEELRTMNVEDKGTFVLDSRTGWPLNVSYTRTMTIAGGSQADELRFTRRDPGDQRVEDAR